MTSRVYRFMVCRRNFTEGSVAAPWLAAPWQAGQNAHLGQNAFGREEE